MSCRRRLREALQMEDVIAAKLETSGWAMVFRAGRKLGKTYVLISAYVLDSNLRVTVRQTL